MSATTVESPAARPAHPQPAVGGWHFVEWAAEFLGTLLMVFGGLSAVVFDFSPGSPVLALIPGTSGRLLLTGALFAATGSLVAVSPMGRRSGAHLNPALTLAFACIGHVHRHDLAGYLVAQFTGAVSGAALLRAVWGSRARAVGYGVTLPGPHTTALGAALLEAVMTALLILLIFGMVANAVTARWTPLAVWLLVTLLVWRDAPRTGTSLNPARSLGPALVAPQLRDLWVYFVGPLLGTALAVLSWRLVPLRTLTAKLYHDPAARSILRTELPAQPARRRFPPASSRGDPARQR